MDTYYETNIVLSNNWKISTLLSLTDLSFTVSNPLQCWKPRIDSWVGKIPWRREWQSTPVIFLGEFHGQRSLEGHSPWGPKEADMTEQPTLSHCHCFSLLYSIMFFIQQFWMHYEYHFILDIMINIANINC